MDMFIVSLLDPVLVLPALAIGYFPHGSMRLWLAGTLMASFVVIGLGYGTPTPAADAIIGRALAAGLLMLLGAGISRVSGRSQRAAQREG